MMITSFPNFRNPNTLNWRHLHTTASGKWKMMENGSPRATQWVWASALLRKADFSPEWTRTIVVAVGTTITGRPPRRSVRARLRIRLLPWMNGGETHCLPHTAQSLGHALPALCRTHV